MTYKSSSFIKCVGQCILFVTLSCMWQINWTAGAFTDVETLTDVAEKSVRWEQSVHSSTVQHEGTDCLGSVTVIMSPAVLHKGVSLHSMKLFMWTWQSAPGAMTQPNKVTSHVNMCWQQRSICQFVSWEADKVHDDWMQMRLANTYFTAACSFYTLFSCLIWDLQV